MSWISKWLGLDKRKDTLNAINAFLRFTLQPEARKVKGQFIEAAQKRGVTWADANTAWEVLLDVLDAPDL